MRFVICLLTQTQRATRGANAIQSANMIQSMPSCAFMLQALRVPKVDYIRGSGGVFADLGELDRQDTPWFAAGEPWHRPTIPEGGVAWGKEMVGAWARALADEVAARCGHKMANK